MAKPGKILKDFECYSQNLGELAGELNKILIDPQTGEFKKIDFNVVRQSISEVFDEADESLRQCSGDGYKDDIRRILASGQGQVGGLVLTLFIQLMGINIQDVDD